MSLEKSSNSKVRVPKNPLPPFLKKLREITETTPLDIASWSEDGKTYIVHSKRFETEVLPQHFTGTLLSFIRQLHFYGFKKIDLPQAELGFQHECFTRDEPHLVFAIKRKTKTETLGSDSVLTSADLKAIQPQMEYIKTTAESMEKDLEQLEAKIKSRFNVDINQIPQITTQQQIPLNEALIGIEKATIERIDE